MSDARKQRIADRQLDLALNEFCDVNYWPKTYIGIMVFVVLGLFFYTVLRS
jgi:hypothetical protein